MKTKEDQTIFQKMSAKMTDEIFVPILKAEIANCQRRANVAIVASYVLGVMLGLSIGLVLWR